MAEEGTTGVVSGPLAFTIEAGALRAIRFDGTEVLRRLDMPIRDADWRTAPSEDLSASIGPGPSYERHFRAGDFRGRFEVETEIADDSARLVAHLTLTAERETVVNRAGFILLHPLRGVVGTPVEVTAPDGTVSTAVFPERISPSQPVRDIRGLRHRIGPVEVAIRMEGEVFEMEDQRNWSDASFKTYCRPLSRPRPFRVAEGETLRQSVTIVLTRLETAAPLVATSSPSRAVMPEILLAHEAALGGTPPAALARIRHGGILLRHDSRLPSRFPDVPGPVTLELVVEDEAAIRATAAACAAAAVVPRRVIAVPPAYLASHQPEGPWPEGPAPADLVPFLRTAFPESEVGGGMLTNFTEFNRHRPDPAMLDFVSFGTTAIVHAGDDASVLETLEALGDIFASAHALAGGRPLRLGLMSIGMRSNPYGAAVAANPEGRRLAMAMEDPRQRLTFAAAWAVAAAAEAARGRVASFAPAMTAGPLGLGTDDDLWPIFHVVEALAALSGQEVEITGGPSSGLVSIQGGVSGLVANLGPDPVRHETGPARHIGADGITERSGLLDLAPFDILLRSAT